jgi:hypothetical protein
MRPARTGRALPQRRLTLGGTNKPAQEILRRP